MSSEIKLLLLALLIAVGTADQFVLNGKWWTFKIGTNTTYLPATVPSTVHTDLMDNGLLKDPYYGANLMDAYWIETLDFTYNLTFALTDDVLSSQNKFLVFEGLDTHCDVFLNGAKVLHANNMFRRWKVPANTLSSSNTLEVRFYSSANYDVAEADKLRQKEGFDLPANYSFTRKAAYQYGWDWGPRLLTVGIWKDVYVEYYNDTFLESVSVRNYEVNKQSNTAKINITTVWKTNPNYTHTITSYFFDGNQSYFSNSSQAKGATIRQQHEIIITNPKLWWTHDVGEPFLYYVTVKIMREGKTIQWQDLRYGIRTVKVLQTSDKGGSEFTIELNGQRMFMRGGNYIPPDMFMSRASHNTDVYMETVGAALFANFNMLRVWGGGQFDHDVFYNLCDKYGLLIWHDLMFACAMYPGGQDIYDNIRQEMIDNLVRLRHHPSIALWNGNNEVWIGWQEWGWKNNKTVAQKTLIEQWYKEIFANTLRSVIAEYDPDRFYWETSPSSSSNSPQTIGSGDIHFWRVWGGGTDIEQYQTYVGRFNSEYGMQSMLQYSSIVRFTEEKDRTIDSYVMRLHQRHIYGDKYLPMYTKKYAGSSTDLERYSYFTQIMQAHALTVAINSLRGNRPSCMGSLYWQINDVWPVSSWATVDYYGMYKAAHYAVRELYWPVQAILRHNPNNKTYSVCAINDGIGFSTFEFSLEIIGVDGTIIRAKQTSGLSVASNTNYLVKTIQESDVIAFAKSSLVVMTLSNPQTNLDRTLIQYFAKPADIAANPPRITLQWLNSSTVNISTTTLARSVYLFDKTREPLLLFDNYFDIRPNGYRIVQMTRQILPENLGWKEYFTERQLSLSENTGEITY